MCLSLVVNVALPTTVNQEVQKPILTGGSSIYHLLVCGSEASGEVTGSLQILDFNTKIIEDLKLYKIVEKGTPGDFLLRFWKDEKYQLPMLI